MTQASKQAYQDDGNKKRRLTHKGLILDFMNANLNKGFTYDEMSACIVELRGKTNAIQKRCSDLYKEGKLSSLFMTLPTISNNELVWDDINRMNTLNANQVNRKKEKHICPLQLDIIERLINRFTMKGDIIDDPFGGLFSTAYKALEMGREAISTELNPSYYDDGLFYLKSIEAKISAPTLFDL